MLKTLILFTILTTRQRKLPLSSLLERDSVLSDLAELVVTFLTNTFTGTVEVAGRQLATAESLSGIVNNVIGATVNWKNLQESGRESLQNALRRAMADDPALREEILQLVRTDAKLHDALRGINQHVSVGGTGNKVGNVIGYHAGNVSHGDQTHIHQSSRGGVIKALIGLAIFAGIVIAIVALLPKVTAFLETPQLTSNTLCREYLAYDTETRYEAVRRVGVEVGNTDAGNPLTAANTDYRCGSHPDWTLGQALAP